ncbi:hypothetical protein M2138_001729 [Dysgonomonadaceae bacterium PH5-43]|nr:hypothetical protein [Dysgonomonadaceae bacterium PH5-43]
MKLEIKNKNGEVKAIVSPSDNSVLTHAAMGEHVLSLSFVLTEYIQLDVDDNILFLGKTYKLLEIYHPTMKSLQEWSYDPKFYGVESELKRALVLKTVDNEFDPVFPLTAPAREHLALIVENINRIKNRTDWKVGEVIASENVVISYNGTYCYDALTELANQLETEWWVEGTTINLTRCEFGNPITLGYNNGLTGLLKDGNDNAKFFTRLYPIGSSRNIVASDYGSSRLQLPGGQKYVEQNLQFGIIEHFEESAFSHIYPRRVGTISSVRTEERTGEEGNPFTVYFFKDSSLNFDPNDYEIAGLIKMVSFESGELLGQKDFEVNYYSNSQEFEIINQYPEGFGQLPGGSLIPKPGDEYILYNIKMPGEYYPLAEAEYKEAVDAYMEKYNLDKSIYKGDTDYIEILIRNLVDLKIGQRINLQSSRYFPETGSRISRITEISRKVNLPSQMTLSFSDVIAKGTLESLQEGISEAMNYARSNASSLPDIIRSWEGTEPTDYNLFSALKSIREFLSKNNDDTARGLITFLKGLEVGDFHSGFLGSGAAITVDEDGITTAEVDKLIVRRYAKFFELIIERLSHIGGQLIISPARMICTEVEELVASYRCYFDTGENGEFVQEFVAGDQARCQVWTGSGTKYYWRLVTGTGSDYIDLSKTDADSGSDIPVAGDHIVQLGNRDNTERQNAQILSSFGEDAPSYKQYSGIDSYSLVDKYVTGFTSKGNRIEGLLNILPGSLGWQNLQGLPEEIAKAADIEVGAVNLVRNSAFSGDYESRYLRPDTQLEPDTEMFSGSLTFWEGDAIVEEDTESASGYSCSTVTRISQALYRPLIDGERYVLSFKAKGNITAKIGTATMMQSITGGYERIGFQFEALQATTIEFSGEFAICEIQLERGTIPTAWSVSPYDNDKSLVQYESLRYMSDAIKGMTQILGGLILTSMIQLGKYKDGVLEKITAGMSGLYMDDNDVAFWGGGTFEQAIRTVMTFANDPRKQLTDDEWKELANVVITHGGRAILNDAIFRGTVYASSGVFKGRIEADEGYFVGQVESNSNGNRVRIDPSGLEKIRLIAESGYQIANLGFYSQIAGRTMGRIQVHERNENGDLLRTLSITPDGINIIQGANIMTINFVGGEARINCKLPTSGSGLDSGYWWYDKNKGIQIVD